MQLLVRAIPFKNWPFITPSARPLCCRINYDEVINQDKDSKALHCQPTWFSQSTWQARHNPSRGYCAALNCYTERTTIAIVSGSTLRIIHVMDHSLPKADGYSIRAKYLLEAQAASGHEITVLTSPSQGADAEDLFTAGICYRRTRYSRWEKKIAESGGKQFVFGRAISRELSSLLEVTRFDVVHAHTPFTVARIALVEARKRHIPFVYEKRNLWEESARARGKYSGKWPFFQVAKAVDRWVTVRADAVCTITEALKANTISLGASADRVFVVGNGADISTFAPRMPEPELRSQCLRGGNFVIGFLGSFFSFEGLPMLVEAYASLRPRFPGARLVLVGDGEDRKRVEHLVNKLGVADGVWMVGSIPHSKVPDFYAAMDVLVYPRNPSKLTEMISPLKPLEPMAMGRCVIGSNVGGICELIRENESGLLFSAGSTSSLIEKLESLLSGQIDASSVGRKARDFVVNQRQWRHMAENYGLAYARATEQLRT
ncbi:MAG: glycosyltransferase family 4 protein [Betaproteobacteria bacterium]